MKIQAAVAWQAGAELSIEEFDLDDPRDDEILVRVEAVGVCHTDDNARLGRLPVVFPIILGHEGAGVVERVGGAVTRVRPGDRVLFTPDYCGRCEQCTLGLTPYCDEVVAVTFTGTRPDGSPRAKQNGRPVRASFFGQSSFATHSLVTERGLPVGRYDQARAHVQLKGPSGNTSDPDLVDASGKVLPHYPPRRLHVAKPVLRVIIGSTRPGRIGPSVAEWIIERAREHGGFDVEVTDLAELNLPMYDEPNHPRLKQYVHQHTKDWSALVEGSDAFIFVMPEYNYGFNAATKNAIDYLFKEWAHKAAGVVSYGGVAAGTRATQMLKQVFSALKVVPVHEVVNIPFVFKHLDEDKRFKSTEEMEQAATAMLDELQKWTEALLTLRGR